MKNRTRMIIIGAGILIFAFVAYNVATHEFLNFDTNIRNFAYASRTPALNKVFVTITHLGDREVVIFVGLMLLLFAKTRVNMGVPYAVAGIASTVLYKIAKSVFQRPRPDEAVRLITEGGYSFPSGHSLNCLVCYGILIYLIRRYCKDKRLADGLTVLLTLLILFIGISRVYVGVHFPTDIIGGWSLGLAFLMVAIITLEKVRGRKNDL